MASNFASTSTYIHSPPAPHSHSSLHLQGSSSSSYQQPPPPFFSSSAPSCAPSPPKRKKASLHHSIDTWIHRDEAIARCFGEDLQGIVHTRQGGSDRFSLKTFSCVKVELVGILVYSTIEERKGEWKRIWVLDDGSSQLIEITEKLFVPRLSNFGNDKHKNEVMFVPPPPRFKNGETLRVTGTLRFEYGRVVTVGLAREQDLVAVGPEEEARHILVVNRLHKEIYPDFDRELYLESDLLPPPKKKNIVVDLPPPRTPKRLSISATASTSQLTTPTKSKSSASQPGGRRGSISFSQPPSSPQSSAFTLSDISLASEPSFSQLGHAAESGRSSSLPDPLLISASDASEDGLKTYLLDYMRGIVDDEWEGDSFEDGGKVGKWLTAEERNPHQARSTSTSSSSTSSSPTSSPWDVDSDSDDENSYHPPSAQPHPSSSRFNTSPEPEPFPPFSVAHLLQVRSLDIYVRKVIQGEIKDRINSTSSSTPSSSYNGGGAKLKRISGVVAKEFGGREMLGMGKAEQRAVWKKRLSGKGGEGSEWRKEKKQALIEQTVNALVREGEVFVVAAQQTQTSYNTNDSTPKPKFSRHHHYPSSETKQTSLYLPTCLSTLGPLLLSLLRLELDRLRSSKPRVPGIRATPNWVKTETLVRRLQSTQERWYFVGEAVVRGVLEAMDDDYSLVEETAGKGWRVVG